MSYIDAEDPITEDDFIKPKERTHMVSQEIWQLTSENGPKTGGMPPEALQMIQDLAEWSTPVAMAVKIQLVYPQVTTKQIHAAWREVSQTFWQRDDEQLLSAKKLLAEYGDNVDIFELVGLPEGVEMLAWGMKRIAEPLRGKIAEIGMDATCEWNLELYSIMGEYDNAGFPWTYCLLSTATAIDATSTACTPSSSSSTLSGPTSSHRERRSTSVTMKVVYQMLNNLLPSSTQ